MNDPQLDEFELWFKSQIANTLEDDATFTHQVLVKVGASQAQTANDLEKWTVTSWLVCMLSVATLLTQSLGQIETETMSGPVLQSLLLVCILLLASWQCQARWMREFE
jgi:hypothetical protein